MTSGSNPLAEVFKQAMSSDTLNDMSEQDKSVINECKNMVIAMYQM